MWGAAWLLETEMDDLGKYLQIVEAAESACVSVVKRPDDALAHARLLSALAPFSGLQPDQLVEVRVLADIVRTRIKAFNARRNSIRAREAIHYPGPASCLTDPRE